jgi:hypothetical protein
MLRILCTGNPNVPGIAKELKQVYPNITFISRFSGYDLLSSEGVEKFSSIIHTFDVFINHSQLIPDGQLTLLSIAAEKMPNGKIINIGSVLEFDQWSWIEPAAAEIKKELKELSLSLNSETLKTTHITVGGLKSTDEDHMRLDPADVVTTIKWLIESKLDIPYLYIDNTSEELKKYWLAKKSTAT